MKYKVSQKEKTFFFRQRERAETDDENVIGSVSTCFIPVFQGLRELLEISQRHASLPKIKRTVTHAEQSVQTDPATSSSCNNNNNNALCDSDATNGDGLTVEITLPMPPVAPPRTPKAAKAGGRMVGGTALTGSSLSITRVESSPEPGGYFAYFFVIYSKM
jgi:hypothetical protein